MRRWTWWLIILVAAALLIVGAYALWRASAPPGVGTNPSPTEVSSPAAQPTFPEDDVYRDRRLAMVGLAMRSRGIDDADVLRAMETVPRHRFVPEDYLSQAYDDHPLPIGYGQTISQPYIVALMTDLLNLDPDERVLEIGTGSGYQAAILSTLVREVYSIEIIPELATIAEERLRTLGFANIRTARGDGYFGWPEQAPFDAIIVTCAPDHVPRPLIDQLAEDGRLVVPIGPPGGYQTLWQYVREADGLRAYNIGGVSFVPLLRQAPE